MTQSWTTTLRPHRADLAVVLGRLQSHGQRRGTGPMVLQPCHGLARRVAGEGEGAMAGALDVRGAGVEATLSLDDGLRVLAK